MKGTTEGSPPTAGRRRHKAWLAIVGLGLLTATSVPSQEPVRVGVVDLDVIVAATAGGQELRAKMAAMEERYRSEEKRLRDDVAQLRGRLTDESSNGPLPEGRAERQSRLEVAERELRRLGEDRELEARRIEEAALPAVRVEIEPVFERLQREHGYDLILDRAPGVVLLVGEVADITEIALGLLEEAR